jgi:hypothetical protein
MLGVLRWEVNEAHTDGSRKGQSPAISGFPKHLHTGWPKRVSPQQPQVNESTDPEIRDFASPPGIGSGHRHSAERQNPEHETLSHVLGDLISKITFLITIEAVK